MAGFRRRARLLTCFYCNQQNATVNDGRVRHFQCPHCDATNYLDQNGDITDPPDSITNPANLTASTSVRYAAPRSSLSPNAVTVSDTSAGPAGSSNIFCQKCLKNQHLFTTSLAQYLPDDPDDPDSAKLERNYFRYRKSRERLYPQICAECEPRVHASLEKAAYTAKTDMLRCMIDRTKHARKVKRKDWLGGLAMVGGWLWIAGLLFQVLWHICWIIHLARMYPTLAEQGPWARQVFDGLTGIAGLHLFTRLLPPPNWLMTWSVATSILCIWWSPRLVQTVRGFTKHIKGLPAWYAYQLITLLIRLVSMKLIKFECTNAIQLDMLMCGHAFAMGFTLFVYRLAPRSIRTDLTPLFATSPFQGALSMDYNDEGPEELEESTDKNMSQILDEILQSPSSNATPTVVARSVGPKFQNSICSNAGTASLLSFSSIPTKRGKEDVKFGALSHSGPAPLAPVSYQQDMDWSPTQSQHRAFSTYGQRAKRTFGDAPVEPKNGPFWFKVPPAPSTPAQRLFNPPQQPRLRRSAVTSNSEIAFGRHSHTAPDVQQLDQNDDRLRQVRFAEPTFFAQQPETNDPRNSLLDMFGNSLSFSEDLGENVRPAGDRVGKDRSWLGGSLFGIGSSKRRDT